MRTRTKRLGIVAGLVTGLALPVMATTASSSTTTVVGVGESNVARQAENTPPTKNWVIYTRNGGAATFRSGPGTPPIGQGSVQLTTPIGADKVQVFNYDHVGTKLSDISAIAYSAYRVGGALQQDAAINIEVDANGDDPGGFTTLVFEPVYNTGQGAVVNGTWQRWDAFNGGDGMWWSSNPIAGAPNRDTFVSWNYLVQQNPNAVIVGGFGLNQGSGNAALTTAVDKLTLGVGDTLTDYNFDVQPTSANDCKKNGWMNWSAPVFKNQGACVSFVNPVRKK